ncbi:MAG: ADP-ribosyltransferase [Nitrososphaerota archaeon]
MAHVTYYYVLTSNPYKIESTEFIGELVELLFSGRAKFISEAQRMELKLGKDYFNVLRKEISSYEERVPLYDINFNHIFLIYRENVYPRILYDNYRFIDKNFYQDLLKLKNPTEADRENIRILSYYDLDVLFQTYLKIFYQSFVLNSYITSCRRPSFYPAYGMEHISPYYMLDELYYLAYDWNLTNKKSLSESEINDLCKKISTYDIPAKTLFDHQMYIYDSKSIGLVKYYSLYGSYYMNLYLRKYRCCLQEMETYETAIRNSDLENRIVIMINLIRNAPAFAKSHTVYRFVEKDDYLRHLKPGDIYQDPSFMSTTRNPFYYQQTYAAHFGYILMKIKLPEGIKGIGLCIESYSNFPQEEEIILPPTSQYRLESVVDAEHAEKFLYIMNKKVIRKYEFTLMGNDYLGEKTATIRMPGIYEPDVKIVEFSKLLADETIKYIPLQERLRYFIDTYANVNNQFRSVISGTTYTFTIESYDSSSIYKPFFFYEVKNGIMITSGNPKYGNINILLEIGPDIHVNYYFKFSVTDPSHVVNLDREEWIQWLSALAYVVGSRKVIIHSNYSLYYNKNDTIEQKQMKTRYTFSQNIYLYLKEKKKLFEKFSDVVVPNFGYPQLDLLENTSVQDIIKPTDTDELFRISQTSNAKNLRELYIFIVENFPKLLGTLEEKLEALYQSDINPFKNINYSLDAWAYLYNKGAIVQIPNDREFMFRKTEFKKLVANKKIQKFKNRLRYYLTNQ